MASKIPPFVEENVNKLTNVVDEEEWKAGGLFDRVDFVVIHTDTLSTPSNISQLPPLQHPSHSSVPALSFVEYLHSTLGFPHSTERHSVTKSHETRDKGKPVTNRIKEGGKGSGSTSYSRRQWRVKKMVHKMVLGLDVGLVKTRTLAL
jgi:hypothetical protein